jgi:hypothetical protein
LAFDAQRVTPNVFIYFGWVGEVRQHGFWKGIEISSLLLDLKNRVGGLDGVERGIKRREETGELISDNGDLV